MSAGQDWNIGELLAPVVLGAQRVPYALVLLNTPIPREHWKAFIRLWKNASFRVCADGAANRILDSVGHDAWSDLPLPSLICGDLDSVRDEVRQFFENQVSHID